MKYCKRIRSLMIVCLFLFMANACSEQIKKPIYENEDHCCIDPPINYAFSEDGGEKINYPENILPQSPWQLINLLPTTDEFPYSQPKLQLSRIYDHESELWITRFSQKGVRLSEIESKLIVYNIDDQIWQDIPDAFSDISSVITGLYIGKKGTIWVIGINPSELIFNSINNEKVIGQYNERDRKFDLLPIEPVIPSGNIIFDSERNIFWVVNQEYRNEKYYTTIYRINPITYEIKKQAETDANIKNLNENSIAITQNGKINMLSVTSLGMWSHADIKMWKFDPDTNKIYEDSKISQKIMSLNLDPFNSIYYTNTGNLWLGDQTWKTSEDKWYQVIRSPIFVTHIPESSINYQWDLPEIIYESSDGRLWFSSFNGLVWLDPKIGKWCWFTTYYTGHGSSLLEDFDKNMWLIVDEKLYEMPLEE